MLRRIALACCLVAVACKSSSNAPSENNTKKPTEGSGAAPQLQRGGVVRLPSNEPKYLNPILEPRFTVPNVLIYEGLLGVDTKGEIVPRLAKSATMSDDGKTITFKLREDVKWHDGEKFTAADVAFTFNAIDQ